ncbi:MAG: hypothetical protein N2319_06750 [Candidatus Kapabacteria bacterium]|nr:hypothetical protein [Candidatus Kapabacteria bacterium]
MKKIILTYILLIFIFSSCDMGLAPKEPTKKSFISGIITYKGGTNNWPPPDSVLEIRLVAFKNYPLSDSSSILRELTEGNAYFTLDTLPRFVEKANYSLEITDPPALLKYIAVAQRYGNLFQWRVIGVYSETGDNTKPSSVMVNPGDSLKNINIEVDFLNLPPQPF